MKKIISWRSGSLLNWIAEENMKKTISYEFINLVLRCSWKGKDMIFVRRHGYLLKLLQSKNYMIF